MTATAADNLQCDSEGLRRPGRAEANQEVRTVIASRMKEARELYGADQGQAANALGYRNSTQLSLIEQGKRLPPYDVLIKAAEVYCTSLDFLTGLADDPERLDLKARAGAALRATNCAIAATAKATAEEFLYHLRHRTQIKLACDSLVRRAEYLAEAFARFRECNEIDDLRRSAMLLRAVEELSDVARTARKHVAHDSEAVALARGADHV